MKDRIIDATKLSFNNTKGLDSSYVNFQGCEAKVIRYAAHQKIPAHRHTKPTMKVILKGRIEFADGVVTTGMLYKCGGWEYQGEATEETHVLLLQEPGTEVIPS